MQRTLSLMATLSLAVATPSWAQGGDIDPIGTYAWEIDVQGVPLAGTLEIAGEDGKWTGLITLDGGVAPPSPLSSVEVDGNVITMQANTPEMGDFLFEITVEDDEFTGTWSFGFEGGEVIGKRVTTD